MEKVTGIGGLFFRSKDPAALGRWYHEHLGITLTPSSYDELPWLQEAGPTAFSPFPESNDYFGDAKQAWMVNFRVRDLDAMAAQLPAAGIAIEVGAAVPERTPRALHDPEGNPVELWEPAGRDARPEDTARRPVSTGVNPGAGRSSTSRSAFSGSAFR
jgi:glyoxylase I family protein